MVTTNPNYIGPVSMPGALAGVGSRPEDNSDPIVVQVHGGDEPKITRLKGGGTRTEMGDGSVVIDFAPSVRDAAIAAQEKADKDRENFYRNLALDMSETDLGQLADDIIQGIDSDIQSRAERMDDLAEGTKMLGLKLEKPSTGSPEAGEGLSRVYHPELTEAVLRHQATASGELLPAGGPFKVTDTGDDQIAGGDDLADSLEKDLNAWIVPGGVATEYYPDTKQMLFLQGLQGSGFKKVYRCPIRRRPVSESVSQEDLIVSSSTTDLGNALRITHRIDMPNATLRRLQILGVYRDVPLGQASSRTVTPVSEAKEEASGTTRSLARPQDQDREIYECYAQTDIPGYEHVDKNGDLTGLPLPYVITIDKDSRQVLEIRRFWKQNDEMMLPKQRFVKFQFVDAMGFYGLGLFHIICNPTRALTALWRMVIDNGLLANYPGGLIDEAAARQWTNNTIVNPLGWTRIQTGGRPVAQCVGQLPYRDVSMAVLALIEKIETTTSRVAGTADLPVGEGRQDAPVGTTIALLEQATKVINAVHKGMHVAQAQEFKLIIECFREDPEAFWRHCGGKTTWNREKFIAALDRCDIIPASDPNVPSKLHRIMTAQAVVMLSGTAPQLYDQRKVHAYALRTLGIADPDDLFQPEGQQPPADPQAMAAQAQTAAKQAEIQARTQIAALTAQQKDKDSQRQAQIETLKQQSQAAIAAQRQQAEDLRNQRDIASKQLINTQDNQTAKDISAAEIEAGHRSDLTTGKGVASDVGKGKP